MNLVNIFMCDVLWIFDFSLTSDLIRFAPYCSAEIHELLMDVDDREAESGF